MLHGTVDGGSIDPRCQEALMDVSEVSPPNVGMVLSGAQFADAFSIVTPETALTARQFAERMFSRSPRWVSALTALRDRIVSPFGLTTTKTARHARRDRIGIFPVLTETPQRLVAGFDDNHLDFRVVIDVASESAGQRVTATTVVLMHNRLGRGYLAVIKPFHRLVVRAMLRQAIPAPAAHPPL
jgi:hypothetical protein